MYRIVICDDDLIFCGQIEQYLFDCCPYFNMQMEIIIFVQGTELLSNIAAEGPFDLLFLDIELLDINGVNIGKLLRSDISNEVTQIVYVSAQMDYALQLFQIRPLDFLLKPIKFIDIKRIVRLYHRLFVENVNFFEYRAGRTSHQINDKYILYFQSEGRMIHMTTTTGVETFYEKLSNIESQLSSFVFFNIHKSFLVNWNHVAEFHINHLVMSNGEVVPISQSRRAAVQEHILETNIAKRDI